MKILYLIDFGFDSSNGSSHLVIRMIHDFLEAGHEVYLVESHSTGQFSDIPPVLQGYSKLTYDIVNRPSLPKKSFVKRYLSGIAFEFRAYQKWKKRIDDIDIVIHHSHYTSPFAALLLKKYKKNVIFNIYDIFPGEAYTNGNISSKFVYNTFDFLEKIIYKTSTHIFTLTEDTKRTLKNLGVPDEKITIIPNWFDDSAICEIKSSENTFIQDFSMGSEKKYIQYAGTLGVSYDFDLILDVAKRMSYRKDIIFQIVGEGIHLKRLKQRVEQEKITNVLFVPWQPMERLSEVYSSCTLQIVPLKKDVIKHSYPSKILPLMACGRIPIVSVESDSYFYGDINKNKVGIAVNLGDIDALIENILLFVDDTALRTQYEVNAKKYIYERYTATESIKRMLEVFNTLHNIKDDIL